MADEAFRNKKGEYVLPYIVFTAINHEKLARDLAKLPTQAKGKAKREARAEAMRTSA